MPLINILRYISKAKLSMYYMVDPWRHLENWNKPANTDDHTFEAFYREAMHATAEFKDKRQVLRGTTLEVIDRIDDGSLDFAYIDGDHTLRGVVIDLVRVYPKLKAGGWLGGDDFCASIWQHSPANEPTLVFPFALHFAEAVGARFYALPHNQFLLERTAQPSFSLVDLTGAYSNTGLRNQFVSLPRVRYAFRRLRYLASRTLRSLRSPSASSPNR